MPTLGLARCNHQWQQSVATASGSEWGRPVATVCGNSSAARVKCNLEVHVDSVFLLLQDHEHTVAAPYEDVDIVWRADPRPVHDCATQRSLDLDHQGTVSVKQPVPSSQCQAVSAKQPEPSSQYQAATSKQPVPTVDASSQQCQAASATQLVQSQDKKNQPAPNSTKQSVPSSQ